MAAILAQNPLVAFRLPCGKVSRDFPLNMAKIGIASANRDQSPIRRDSYISRVGGFSDNFGQPDCENLRRTAIVTRGPASAFVAYL